RFFQALLELEQQAGLCHLQQVQACLTRWQLQILIGPSADLQYLELLVHDDSRRYVAGQQEPVGLALQFDRSLDRSLRALRRLRSESFIAHSSHVSLETVAGNVKHNRGWYQFLTVNFLSPVRRLEQVRAWPD